MKPAPFAWHGPTSVASAVATLAELAASGAHAKVLAGGQSLVPVLAERMREGARDRWLAELERAGVPAGPINTIDQVYQDPQVVARGMRRDLPHPAAGTAPTTASPLRFSGSPVQYRNAPPMLGQHTAEVLRERLGLTEDEIRALAEERG